MKKDGIEGEMLHKKRRFDRCLGCMADLNGDLSNVKMKEDESEDICSLKSERVTIMNREK